jgi:CheY-like chemotaxis protein
MEVLANEEVNIILTDLMLPGMSGLEFIRWVRGAADYNAIPIVAMSAYDETYLAAAIMAGADAGLHKPEDIDKLVDTIKQVLGSRGGEVGRSV